MESVSSLYAVPAHSLLWPQGSNAIMPAIYTCYALWGSQGQHDSTRGDIFMRLTLSVLRADSWRQMWPLERNKNAGNLLVKRNERERLSSRRGKMLFQGRSPGEGWGEFGHTWEKKRGVKGRGLIEKMKIREISVCWSVPGAWKLCVATSSTV